MQVHTLDLCTYSCYAELWPLSAMQRGDNIRASFSIHRRRLQVPFSSFKGDGLGFPLSVLQPEVA